MQLRISPVTRLTFPSEKRGRRRSDERWSWKPWSWGWSCGREGRNSGKRWGTLRRSCILDDSIHDIIMAQVKIDNSLVDPLWAYLGRYCLDLVDRPTFPRVATWRLAIRSTSITPKMGLRNRLTLNGIIRCMLIGVLVNLTPNHLSCFFFAWICTGHSTRR